MSGFSIFGTLDTDSRRYEFSNEVEVIDLGLRLTDVNAMRLQSEKVEDTSRWHKQLETAAEHGATAEEVAFLSECQRVDLNSMTSGQFIEFLEPKLVEHGVQKVIPGEDVLERHARKVVKDRLLQDYLDDGRGLVEASQRRSNYPKGLTAQARKILERDPALPWVLAVAEIVEPLV